MIGHGAKLPRKRQQAIAALIEAPTIREAAGMVGIGEATLFRWMQDQKFQRVYHDAKQQIVNQAISRLQKASGEAVETLREIMNDTNKPPNARVSCAKTILDMATKALEMDDLSTRIETLEKRVLG